MSSEGSGCGTRVARLTPAGASRYLRRLEAVMIVVDEAGTNVQLTGTGDVRRRPQSSHSRRSEPPEAFRDGRAQVLESQDGIVGIGSGGAFATAAVRRARCSS